MILKGAIGVICLLLGAVHVAAQEPLRFERSVWDFGSIREADGPVSHTFTARNVSDKPVVIVEVSVSCGCLKPDYSRKPILPGEEVSLRVAYDPSNRPGRFDKQVSIFVSQSRTPLKLGVTGFVVARNKSVEELYPLDAGGGVRLETNFFAFSYLRQDEAAHTTVGVVNTSDREVALQLVPLRASGFLTIDAPAKLAPAERAEIALHYLVPRESGFYGTVRDELSVRIDGRLSALPVTTHGIAVDRRDIVFDQEEPVSRIDPVTVRFAEVRKGAVVPPQRFTLYNDGGSPLVVQAVETGDRLQCSLRPGDRIAAGKSLDAEVRFDTGGPQFGALVGRITLITNDPVRPMRKVRVTAIVTE